VDVDIDQFRDVMIADGTVLQLHRFLSEYVFTPKTQRRVQPEHVKSSRCFERFA
jgi:hypothetical protein